MRREVVHYVQTQATPEPMTDTDYRRLRTRVARGVQRQELRRVGPFFHQEDGTWAVLVDRVKPETDDRRRNWIIGSVCVSLVLGACVAGAWAVGQMMKAVGAAVASVSPGGWAFAALVAILLLAGGGKCCTVIVKVMHR